MGLMADLEYYGIMPPVVRVVLPSLLAWQASKDVAGSRDGHIRSAQAQAHHLPLLIELAVRREESELTGDELIELAGDVVAHPKTFNPKVLGRLAWVLDGAVTTSGWELSTFAAESETMMTHFLSQKSGTHDCGRIMPSMLDSMRDTCPPRQERLPASTCHSHK